MKVEEGPGAVEGRKVGCLMGTDLESEGLRERSEASKIKAHHCVSIFVMHTQLAIINVHLSVLTFQ